MENFSFRNVSFAYPDEENKALRDISFSVSQGEFLILCGPSGCGKSTLLRHFKTCLAPHGASDGEIFFDGRPLEDTEERIQAQKIGFVQQSPENQVVTDKVWHELAFGLESLGYDTPTIRRRVAEVAAFFGIENWFYKNVTELSGGQKQILSLAGVVAMSPEILVLDEPTAQLDPIAASDFLSLLGKINRELGITIILSEHRLEEAFPFATRVIVMDKGEIVCDDLPEKVGLHLRDKESGMFLAMPTAMRVWAGVKTNLPCPLTVRDGSDFLSQRNEEKEILPLGEEKKHTYSEDIALECDELWFRYEKNLPDVVKGFSLTLHKGEFYAILGGNGTGKSTTLKVLAGLRRAYRGNLRTNGRVGMLPQNPQTLFVKKTVREDLYEALRDTKLSKEEKDSRVAEAASFCSLNTFLDRHPYDISGGEQQRTALAKVLLTSPDILLLDEPTKGFDAEFKVVFADIISKLTAQGITVLMVSHDVTFCAEYAHKCGMFFDGNIVADGTPREFFSGNSFYTTPANRMARKLIPEAVTVDEIIACCGGEIKKDKNLPDKNVPLPEPERKSQSERKGFSLKKPKDKSKLSKRTTVASAVALLLIPITVLAGVFCFDNSQYNIVALLVLLECMLPFVLVFEGRKPKARELVTIAVLCAIGVAGRGVFFMLPQFKPVIALTIVAGVAFGGETGFFVGAVTMLTSNMLFSQGPWTPWQMFAAGIIGYLAGVLFKKGWLRRTRASLAVFGAFSTVAIYGVLMNLSSAFVFSAQSITLKTLTAYLASGLPMDLIHSFSTVLFILIAAEPMLEKLERIKLKYGLVR